MIHHPDHGYMTRVTDDLGPSPEFLADEDIARDDYYHDGPRCGGPVYEDGENVGCPGCRKCCSPDHECKPYGFGIERFEDPALEEANRQVHEHMDRVFGAYSLRLYSVNHFGRQEHIYPPLWAAERNRLWNVLSRQSLRRLRHSEIVWDRLCDGCETHKDAVKAYREWAARAVKIRYRDEK